MKTTLKLSTSILIAVIISITMTQCKPHKAPEAPEAPAAKTIKDTTTAAEPVKPVEEPAAEAKPITKQVPLTLTITNLATTTGPVIVGAYGTKNKFPDPNDQLKEYKFKPHGTTLVAKITNLKFGTYALAIYQDVNCNGKIDKNLLGIPTEPYAFSNNYKPTIKAPGFDNCRFDYDEKNNTVNMTMIR